MIKNFELFKESLLDKMKGKTEIDFLAAIKSKSSNEILSLSIENNIKTGVIFALEHGATLDDCNIVYLVDKKFLTVDELYKYIKNSKNLLFLTGVVFNRIKYVKEAIKKGADVNSGYCLLPVLVEKEYDYFMYDNYSHEYIDMAYNLDFDTYDMISYLLEKGVDEDIYDAFSFAVVKNDLKVIELLLNHGFNVDSSYLNRLKYSKPDIYDLIKKHKKR